MANLPDSGQAASMDSLTVTREQFRLSKGRELEFLAQALGNVSGAYTTQPVDPLAVTLQGTPTIAAAAEPAAGDSSLRIPTTQWVKKNGTTSGSTPPSTPVRGQTWIDTSQDPPVLNIWDDTPPPGAWVQIGAPASVPDATELIKGIGAIATQAEADAGTDDTKFITPLKLTQTLTGAGGGAGFMPADGGTLTGSLVVKQVSSVENEITAGAFDLAEGNFWRVGAIAVPAPTNAVPAMSGVIRMTAAPTGWDAVFKHPGGTATAPTAFPAVVPFYVVSSTEILLGYPTGGIS